MSVKLGHRASIPARRGIDDLAPPARSNLGLAIAAILSGAAALHGAPLHAAVAADPADSLEEIVVTSRKREESLQNVPVSVQAIGGDALEQLGAKSFEDYAQLLPSVSYKSLGVPGSATVLMRGISDGGDGNASGSQPSVGIYLDEAPVTTISSNLDVHIYDVARIEALAGPQGTLFGASAESGVLRIVTNKPNTEKFEGRIDVGGGATDGGAGSRSVEAFVNIPLGTKAAIRLVGWALDDGGWIDNVPGTRTYTLEGGYGYNPNHFGRVATLTNDSLVKKNVNDSKNDGYRAALKVDLAEHWTGTVSVTGQDTKSKGVWEIDPISTGNDHSIQRFTDEPRKDNWTQAAWTLEGQFGSNRLTYAGSHLDRHIDYTSDYSKYGEDAYFVPYYACDYSATGPNLKTQSATDCTSLYEYYVSRNHYKRTSHELRLQSTGDGPLQYVAGIFYQQATHRYVNLWIQPGMSPTLQVPGYDISNVYFRTDQERKDTQKAAFGELYYDITGSLRATLGMRHYDESSAVKGVVGWGPGNFCTTDPTCRDTFSNSSVGFSGQIYKGNLSYKVSPDHMLYLTYSEGYRPGGENRDPGLLKTVGTQAWQPDKLKNYEFGWKTTWLDNRLRWNGAMYVMDWSKIQYTEYDFSLSACCGNVYNLSSARAKGVETDLAWVIARGLTLTPSLSYNDAKTTGDFTLPTFKVFSVPSGTELPNVPKLKANARIRYEFPLAGYGAFVQANGTHVGSSWSRIRPTERYPQSAYNVFNAAAGLGKERWGGEMYFNNVTNEVADLFVHPRKYEYSVVTNRPFSYGLRAWYSF
jgi:outer membrane receptor protein involved in Fe transport